MIFYQNNFSSIEENIMTEPGNILDLINQSAVTPKHMVCITISLLKGTGPMGNICHPQINDISVISTLAQLRGRKQTSQT